MKYMEIINLTIMDIHSQTPLMFASVRFVR